MPSLHFRKLMVVVPLLCLLLRTSYVSNFLNDTLVIPDLPIFTRVKIPVGIGNFISRVHHKWTFGHNGFGIFFPAEYDNVSSGFGMAMYFNGSFVVTKRDEFTFAEFLIVDHCVLQGKEGRIFQSFFCWER